MKKLLKLLWAKIPPQWRILLKDYAKLNVLAALFGIAALGLFYAPFLAFKWSVSGFVLLLLSAGILLYRVKDKFFSCHFFRLQHYVIILLFIIPVLLMLILLRPGKIAFLPIAESSIALSLSGAAILLPATLSLAVRAVIQIPPRWFSPLVIHDIESVRTIKFPAGNKGLRWVFLDKRTLKEQRALNVFHPPALKSATLGAFFQASICYYNFRTGTDSPIVYKNIKWSFKSSKESPHFINHQQSLRGNGLRFHKPSSKELNVERSSLPSGFQLMTIYVIQN